MKTSLRSEIMQESPIRKLAAYADEANKKGITVYPLNIGQPDIPTPEPIMNAIRSFPYEILNYGPSQGENFTTEAFACYYKKIGINLDAKDLIVTAGGSEAILFAYLTICDIDDEIIVFEPFYTNYNGIATETGVKLKAVTTYAEDGFKLPPNEEIEKAITNKTKAILICNPNNPTGTVYSKEELERLAAIAIKHDLFIISDEVYREFVYDGQVHTSVLSIESIKDRAILCDSVSKRYSACGARIGVIASKNKDFMAKCLKFAQARLSAPMVDQWGAAEGLKMDLDYFKPVLEEYTKRRNTVMEALDKIPGVICKIPGGAFYAIVKLPIKNAERFAKWLITDFSYEKKTVLVAPAAGFYVTKGRGLDEIRISYVLHIEWLKTAMNLLTKGLEEYRKIE